MIQPLHTHAVPILSISYRTSLPYHENCSQCYSSHLRKKPAGTCSSTAARSDTVSVHLSSSQELYHAKESAQTTHGVPMFLASPSGDGYATANQRCLRSYLWSSQRVCNRVKMLPSSFHADLVFGWHPSRWTEEERRRRRRKRRRGKALLVRVFNQEPVVFVLDGGGDELDGMYAEEAINQ